MDRHAPPSPEWLDEQYNNRARVPEHEQVFARWRQASQLTREKTSRRLDLPYGQAEGEMLDVFPAPRDQAPVLVFIHGGYWRSLDKADHSFIAPSFVEAGAMVVVPNYALCPAVTIEAIALQMVQAVGWVVRHAALYGGDPQRIAVAGHSAGGHLAAMLACCDWASVGLPADTVKGALSISGLYDLAPVAAVPFLKSDLRLTPAQVRRLSPAGFPPPKVPLHAYVGGDESEEFIRHNRLIRERWGEAAVPVCDEVPGANHFDVLHALVDAGSPVHRSALDLLGLQSGESTSS